MENPKPYTRIIPTIAAAEELGGEEVPQNHSDIGIIEKKMETTTVYLDYMGNNKEEIRNYYSILGLCWDSGNPFQEPTQPFHDR